MTGRECFRCGATEDLERFGRGLLCPDCRPDGERADHADDPGEEPGEPEANPRLEADKSPEDSDERAREAFVAAIDWFHGQLNRDLPDDDHPATPREYFRERRGWTDATIDAKRLGYAPASPDALLNYLMGEGFDRETLLATGLFWDGLEPIWRGRLVLPYLDADGRPAFAISRRLDPAHPADRAGDYGDGPAKYHKIPVSRDPVAIEEPIYGLDTVREGEPVLITEGIADAITAHQAGYPCLSPVTTTFKHEDREGLLTALSSQGVSRVYLIQDAERPTSDVDDRDRLTLQQFGEGVRGAVKTAAHLSAHGLEARVADLPRPGLDKVDLDDYLQDWSDDLTPLLASATPVDQHPAHEPDQQDTESDTSDDHTGAEKSASTQSAVFDLDITDVTGKDEGFRGTNPLGHHGESEDYFVVYEDDGDLRAGDHKYGVTYTPLTYLLADHSESSRSPGAPGGALDDEEILLAWRHAKERGDIADDDPIPRRALQAVAREATVWDGELVEHETPGGDTFEGLPSEVYNTSLEAVRDKYGVDPGRQAATRQDSRDSAGPTDRDVTLDPAIAWRAAAAVAPGDLDDDLGDVPTDGDEWRCPRCEESVDVVRAAALNLGMILRCDGALSADEYTRAYNYARDDLGAPLPEYVNSATATRNWDVVTGALRELTFNHLNPDTLASEVTATGSEVSGDAALALDPAWRESESGASVLVFESGTVYEAHPDHDDVLDVLRFVALDAGIVPWEAVAESDDFPALEGDRFWKVYRTARQRYDAPLPEWDHGSPNVTPVLPPTDALVDARQDTDARLEAAYDQVAEEYAAAASSDDATLLRVLPGLGKTENVFRQADEFPALYAAGRKELMAAAVERAEENGVSAYLLPVFSKRGPPGAVVEAGVEAVRERGQGLLREPWRLYEAVEERLAAVADLDAPDGVPDPEACEPDDELDRESCTTADGEHHRGLWLAAHVARGLGYSPRYIHTHASALFGTDLPCTGDDHDGCPYSEAWERATDPDAPVDVLVGHYTHAHVDGARTYHTRGPNDRIEREPRTIVLDEFPGDTYADRFGEEFADMAAWLAGCLRDDVDDRQGMFQRAGDLWDDDHLRGWLEEGTDTETMPEFATASAALGVASDVLDAVDTAEWLLDAREGVCADLGIDDALRRLVDTFPEWEPAVVREVAAALTDAIEANRGGHEGVMRHVAALADHDALHLDGDRAVTDRLADRLDAAHISGDLAALVERAIDAYRDREERATVLLENAARALRGGEAGVEELAAYASDAHAHPQAHALLYGVLAPDGEGEPATTLETDTFSFDPEPGTRIQRVPFGHDTVLVDRQHNGAAVMDPPAFTAGGGENPVVGLDATGRRRLWELAIGRDVTRRDIHDSKRERRAFLRDVFGLRIIQTSSHVNSYEGDPSGKNFDDDLAVVEKAAEEYGGAVLDTGAELDDAPAVITTKVVENTVDELHDVASITEHYGDLKGSERLKNHRLAALLGCQHYGDAAVEWWSALAGEEVTRTGHGAHLDYNSEAGNTALRHMREDQVMQVALRFGRDTDGAVVLAHTAALRDDLPVVGEGEVMRTYSDRAQAVAEVTSDLVGRRFTTSDVYDRLDRQGVDISRRTVRRVLAELADSGYLDREEHGEGLANEYALVETPPAAEIDLPSERDLGASTKSEPGQSDIGVSYTVSVRVPGNDGALHEPRIRERAVLAPPAPGASVANGSDPALHAPD